MATDTSKITTAANNLGDGLTKGGGAAKTLGAEIANAIKALDSRVTALESAGPAPPDPIPPPDGGGGGGGDGWPDASNTGVAAGITLQDHSGLLEVKTAGAVVKNMRVTGAIVVMANNVTVQDCEVNAGGQMYGIGAENVSGLKVTRCHVYGDGGPDRDRSYVSSGVQGAVEVSFCNIHGCENAVVQGVANFYMHDNYIHDFALWLSVAEDHTDGLQTWGWADTGGLRVIHNTIIGIATGGECTPTDNKVGSSCIALIQGQHDLVVDDNYLAGGTYCIYGNAQEGGSPANTKVTNNHFSTAYRPKGGEFGFSAGFASNAVWTGNVVHETGAEVPRG